MKKLLSPARGVLAAALIAGLAMPAQAQLREALNTGEQATRRAEQVQDQINQLDDERTDMVREYRSLLQRRDAADLYAKQQALVVKSQEEEIESLTEQLGSIDDITAQTVPMLLEMIENLKAFVAADLPFKQEERTTRLEGLDAVGHCVRRVAEVAELQQRDFPVHLIVFRHQNPERLGLAPCVPGGCSAFAGEQPGDALEQPGLLDRL